MMWWFVPLLLCCSVLDIVLKLPAPSTTSPPAPEPPSSGLPALTSAQGRSIDSDAMKPPQNRLKRTQSFGHEAR